MKAGLFKISDVYDPEFDDRDEYGLKLSYNNMQGVSGDACMLLKKGTLGIYTGYASSGKSEFVENVMIDMLKYHNWNFGIFSPEHPRRILANRLIQKYFEQPINEVNKNHIAKQRVMEELNNKISIVDSEDIDRSDDKWLMKMVEEAYAEYNIDAFVIDAYNTIQHDMDAHANETNYIGDFLERLKKLAKRLDIHIAIVAHPKKPSNYSAKVPKNTADIKELSRIRDNVPIPTLYDISSSSNWWNKADYGVVVFRKFDVTNIIIQKVKTHYHGKEGVSVFRFNTSNGVFYEA